jgi:hypothetical protein
MPYVDNTVLLLRYKTTRILGKEMNENLSVNAICLVKQNYRNISVRDIREICKPEYATDICQFAIHNTV